MIILLETPIEIRMQRMIRRDGAAKYTEFSRETEKEYNSLKDTLHLVAADCPVEKVDTSAKTPEQIADTILSIIRKEGINGKLRRCT